MNQQDSLDMNNDHLSNQPVSCESAQDETEIRTDKREIQSSIGNDYNRLIFNKNTSLITDITSQYGLNRYTHNLYAFFMQDSDDFYEKFPIQKDEFTVVKNLIFQICMYSDQSSQNREYSLIEIQTLLNRQRQIQQLSYKLNGFYPHLSKCTQQLTFLYSNIQSSLRDQETQDQVLFPLSALLSRVVFVEESNKILTPLGYRQYIAIVLQKKYL